MALDKSLLRGSLGGWVAAAYCLFVSLRELGGSSYRFFGNPTLASMGVVFGIASLVLLLLAWRSGAHRHRFLFLISRNLSAVFALILVVFVFASGVQPDVQILIRLVFQLGLVWIVYTSMRFLCLQARVSQKG